MKGKMTISRSGSTGSVSGILTGSSSLRTSSFMRVLAPGLPSPRLSFLVSFHWYDRFAFSPVLHARNGDGEKPAAQSRLGLLKIEGQIEGYPPLEAAQRPLHA